MIKKQYKGTNEIIELTLQEAISELEPHWYISGTVKEIAESGGGMLQTMSAYYTI